MKKILVFGATGMLAVPVVQELVKAGYEVTVFVRNAQKAHILLPDEVSIFQGDIRKPVDVERALEGKDTIYLNLSVRPEENKHDFHTENEGLHTILPLAKAADIKRIGYISSLVQRYQGMNGFSWWVFDIKAAAIQMIKDSGIPYTIFYPSTFMENFDKGGYVQGNRINLAGTSYHPMYFIAGADYGRQVAKALQLPSAANQEYVVQGPEAFTAYKAAKVYAENYRKARLSIIKAPLGIIKFLGMFNHKLNYLASIIEALNNYPEKFESEITWKELGRPQITFEEYSKQS